MAHSLDDVYDDMISAVSVSEGVGNGQWVMIGHAMFQLAHGDATHKC